MNTNLSLVSLGFEKESSPTGGCKVHSGKPCWQFPWKFWWQGDCCITATHLWLRTNGPRTNFFNLTVSQHFCDIYFTFYSFCVQQWERFLSFLTWPLFVCLVRSATTWKKKLRENLISGKNHRQWSKSNHCQPHWMDKGRSEVEEGTTLTTERLGETITTTMYKNGTASATFFFFLQGIERWRSVLAWRRSENMPTEWPLLRLVIKHIVIKHKTAPQLSQSHTRVQFLTLRVHISLTTCLTALTIFQYNNSQKTWQEQLEK